MSSVALEKLSTTLMPTCVSLAWQTNLLSWLKPSYWMSTDHGMHLWKTISSSNIHINTPSSEGYGLLLESSVTFLMLCWTQTLCWSSSFSLRARSSSSAFRSISLSAISLVLHPGPTPLKHKDKRSTWSCTAACNDSRTRSWGCSCSLTPCVVTGTAPWIHFSSGQNNKSGQQLHCYFKLCGHFNTGLHVFLFFLSIN